MSSVENRSSHASSSVPSAVSYQPGQRNKVWPWRHVIAFLTICVGGLVALVWQGRPHSGLAQVERLYVDYKPWVSGEANSAGWNLGDPLVVGVGDRLMAFHAKETEDDLEPFYVSEPIGAPIEAMDFYIHTYAYLAAGEQGLMVFDYLKGQRTAPSDRLEMPSLENREGLALDVDVQHPYVYVAGGSHLLVVSLPHPGRFEVISTLPMPMGARRVIVANNLAYVATDRGLSIVSLEDKSDPKILSRLSTPSSSSRDWELSDLELIGTTLVAADPWTGLRIIDVSNPRRPRQSSHLPLPKVSQLDRNDGLIYAYTAQPSGVAPDDQEGRLYSIEIDAEQQARIVGESRIQDERTDLVIDGPSGIFDSVGPRIGISRMSLTVCRPVPCPQL